jgi:glycosyltransferase involved in cell wall biosynthesis
MSRETLLVVAHAADRAGSVKVLLDVMHRVTPGIELPVSVQLQAGGPLADDLLALGSPERPDDRPVAIWVNNAAAAGCLWAHPGSTPVLVHVHEEDEALAVLPTRAVDALRDRADAVVCVSERSAAQVVRLGVDSSRVHLVPPPVNAPSIERGAVERLRDRLGLLDRRVVLGCGEATWRKGADLFVEVAAQLATDPELEFLWVGRRRPHPFAAALERDTDTRGLGGRLRWLGEVSDPSAHLALADVLVMTSREDPRPLVPLEAALVGTPTAAFEVGGLAVMAAEGAAATVPYPDCAALAATTRALLDDPTRSSELADRAARIARRDHDPDTIAEHLSHLLTGLLDRTVGRV